MKAQIHVIEAVIACTILAILMLAIYKPQASPELSRLNYKFDAYYGLKILDEVGILRKLAAEKNVSGIESNLNPYIRCDYQVALFNETTNITALPSLSSDEVVTLSYYLAGEPGNYTAIEIVVYLWGFD